MDPSIGIIGGADGPTAVFVTGFSKEFLIGLAVIAVGAYLLGSVNFGVLISRLWFREDVRSKGSGNAGSTNMLRTYGKKAAIVTLLGDMGKGAVAVLLGRAVMSWIMGSAAFGAYGAHIAAIFAVFGHLWPIWFGFKGGKGVATAAGAILATEPIIFLGIAVVFWVLALTTKIVSLSSICAAGSYPILMALYCWYKGRSIGFPTCCALFMGGLIIWMHRANIRRLMNGTEYKFGQKKDGKK